jgi:hypothetical protein
VIQLKLELPTIGKGTYLAATHLPPMGGPKTKRHGLEQAELSISRELSALRRLAFAVDPS